MGEGNPGPCFAVTPVTFFFAVTRNAFFFAVPQVKLAFMETRIPQKA